MQSVASGLAKKARRIFFMSMYIYFCKTPVWMFTWHDLVHTLFLSLLPCFMDGGDDCRGPCPRFEVETYGSPSFVHICCIK